MDIICEDYTAIEQQLLDYSVITKRLDALYEEAKKSKMLDIALKLGPSNGGALDITKPRVQTSSPQDWIYNFDKECAKVTEQEEGIKEEIIECLEKQANIKMLVAAAGLTEKQKLYVQLRYYQGKLVAVVARNMGYEKENIKRIRRLVLKKIQDAAV